MQDHADRLEEAMEQLEFVHYEHWTWDEEQQRFIWYGERSVYSVAMGEESFFPGSALLSG